MLMQLLLSILPYAAVTAFTPGPNNILALSTVSNLGWKKGRITILGIGVGFLSVMVICALVCFELARILPALTGYLKYVGAVYILWLAIHVARSKPEDATQSKNGSFWTGFLLQFLNVKIILYAITVYTGYVLPVSSSPGILLSCAIFNSVVGLSGVLTWSIAGEVFRSAINQYYRPFNLIMALILIWSAINLVM